MAHTIQSLPHMQKTQIVVSVPLLGLAQPWLFWAFTKWAKSWVCINMSDFHINKMQKNKIPSPICFPKLSRCIFIWGRKHKWKKPRFLIHSLNGPSFMGFLWEGGKPHQHPCLCCLVRLAQPQALLSFPSWPDHCTIASPLSCPCCFQEV